jgi:hypothetical protein
MPAGAQEFQRINGNIGGGLAFPVSGTADVANMSGHFVLGAGANINQRFGINGEFLWLRMPIKDSVLTEASVNSASVIELSVTANGIVRFPLSNRVSAYAIGGGGWYDRSGSLVIQGAGTIPAVVCGAFLNFFGVNCVSVSIPSDQVPASNSSHAFGGNIGGGITRALGERGPKLYTEVRYHYAPHANISTEHLLLSFGVRW